ncbi:hypothetical protein DL767_005477 [Monosporascus sp. MG133]|nr:hypothetical protein DL767_005477 [Monosporascus sp. MG133]
MKGRLAVPEHLGNEPTRGAHRVPDLGLRQGLGSDDPAGDERVVADIKLVAAESVVVGVGVEEALVTQDLRAVQRDGTREHQAPPRRRLPGRDDVCRPPLLRDVQRLWAGQRHRRTRPRSTAAYAAS